MEQSSRCLAQTFDQKGHQLCGVAERQLERLGTAVVVPHTEIDETAVEVPGSTKDPTLVVAEQDAAGRKLVHLSNAHGLIVDLWRRLSRRTSERSHAPDLPIGGVDGPALSGHSALPEIRSSTDEVASMPKVTIF